MPKYELVFSTDKYKTKPKPEAVFKRKTLSNKLFTNVLVIEESICRIVQSKRDNPNKEIDFSKYPYFTKQLNSEQNAISKQ